MTEGIFGLSGDDYWTDPRKNSGALFKKHALGGKFGFFVDAPPEVVLGERETFPLLVLYSQLERVAYDETFEGEAKLVLVRLSDRKVQVDTAVPQPLKARIGKDSPDPMLKT